MKMTIVTLILLLAACRGERVEREESGAAPASGAGTPAAEAAAAPQAKPATVRNADGSELLTITESDGVVEISFSEGGSKRTLRGEERDTGKRKYQVDGGPVMFEVKPDNDSEGFKLRLADGTLRWKVKVSADKIKISDNEQNANPFELKVREGDRVKVVGPGDAEVGNVRLDKAGAKTEVENAAGKAAFVVEGSRPSGAYGVLLLDAVPQVQRYIVLAELLSRGR